MATVIVHPGGYATTLWITLPTLEDFIAKVGRGCVSLVGHSMGGSVSAYFTGVYPQRDFQSSLCSKAWDRPTTTGPAGLIGSARGFQPGSARASEAAANATRRSKKLPHDCAPPIPSWAPEPALRLAEVSTVRTPDGRFQFKHDPLHLTPAPSLFMVDGATTLWRRIACETLLIDGQDSEFRHS